MPAKLFNNPDQLDSLFTAYLDYCDDQKKMANIAGFCRFCKHEKGFKIHRDSFYEYAKNPAYSDTIKEINDCLEDETLNNTTQKDLIKLAYLNNKCGYKTEANFNLTAQTAPPDVEQLKAGLYDLLSGMSQEQKQALLNE